ncbi:PEP-CTERM sorting domain-containing protein [Mucisphaera sp.]|uniref:PEP-CTERM sorting domain-containing protein n=1 Tax=Mucisphaera sp. TaxID=2913024 RepID=UPI003D12E159
MKDGKKTHVDLSRYALAAFGLSVGAGSSEAGVVTVDLGDTQLGGGWTYLDINADSVRDMGIFVGGGYGGYVVIRSVASGGYPTGLSGDLDTLTSGSDANNLESFGSGVDIGPGSLLTNQPSAGAQASGAYGLSNNFGIGNFLGFQIDLDGAGPDGPSFGWLRLDIDHFSSGFPAVTIYEAAYETNPGTEIRTPEPTSLALLAAGLGALATRRR